MQEAASLRDFGSRPLVVLTAGVGNSSKHQAAQDELAGLSTNSVHQTIDWASHEALVADQAGAAVTTQAILDVVASVRSGGPLVGNACAKRRTAAPTPGAAVVRSAAGSAPRNTRSGTAIQQADLFAQLALHCCNVLQSDRCKGKHRNPQCCGGHGAPEEKEPPCLIA
jgi:hypothetical protein